LTAPLLTQPQELAALNKTLKELPKPPALIVIDTLARCFVGGDENSAKDMGLFVQACRGLQAATGGALLVVHHTGKPKKNSGDPGLERGSSALRAAADAVLLQVKKNDMVTITNEKQKDDEEFKPVSLRLKQIDLGNDPVTKRSLNSCVLVDAELDGSAPGDQKTDLPNESEQLALVALAPLVVAPSGEWHGAVSTLRQKEIPEKTFHNWRRQLVELGLVEPAPEHGPHSYRLTAAGKSAANGMPSGVL
jgi:hypothetical protein